MENKMEKQNKTSDIKEYRKQYKLQHKNEEKEYNKNYYNQNKDKIKESQNVKVLCPCCKTFYTKWNESKHIKSNKHNNNLTYYSINDLIEYINNLEKVN